MWVVFNSVLLAPLRKLLGLFFHRCFFSAAFSWYAFLNSSSGLASNSFFSISSFLNDSMIRRMHLALAFSFSLARIFAWSRGDIPSLSICSLNTGSTRRYKVLHCSYHGIFTKVLSRRQIYLRSEATKAKGTRMSTAIIAPTIRRLLQNQPPCLPTAPVYIPCTSLLCRIYISISSLCNF